jgi:anti-sigma factor RsiW
MPCEPFQDALMEAVASGEEPRGELSAHLKDCAACQAVFEREQSLFASIDSGMRAVANAEVPPSLLPRVRTRLDEAAAPRYQAPSPKWYVLAGASAMLAFFFVLQSLQRPGMEQQPAEAAANTAQASPQTNPPQRGNPGTAAAPNPAFVVPRTHAFAERDHVQRSVSNAEPQPEILVPRDQEVLLASYAAELRRYKGAAVVTADLNESTLAPLEVPPIQIAELDVKLLAESE